MTKYLQKDLIQKIEHNGEVFIPIVKIAALAFNYNEKTVLKKCKSWVNESYDCCAWHTFDLSQLDRRINKGLLQISNDFNISVFMDIEGRMHSMHFGNQIKVFKLLVEWGFVCID